MTDEEKIYELERQLDDVLLKVFDLEKKQNTNGLMRNELEETLRSIYYECLLLRESDDKPAVEKLRHNFSANIRKLMEEYKLRL